MNKTMEHLNSETRLIIDKTVEEKINYLFKDKWIGYPNSKAILDKMEELVNLPVINRMPNLLLIGDTNNGKSAILNRFISKFPKHIDPEKEVVTRPVFYVQAPPVPDEGRFYNIILEESFIPHKKHDRIDRKQLLVLNVLRTLGVKVLVIDEVQHILTGTINKQRVFLNVLKYLSNELKISIIGAGTKEAYYAINADPQLGNRFQLSVLPKWNLNEDYLRLLATFEQMLPLKERSNLAEPTMANQILALSQGTIGEISALLKEATKTALKSNQERISLKILEKTNYIPPSERKKQLDKLAI